MKHFICVAGWVLDQTLQAVNQPTSSPVAGAIGSRTLSDDYLTPEAKARYERIDPALRSAGWVVQRFKEMNLGAAEAVAVREFPTPCGRVDYLLYVDRQGDRHDRGQEGGSDAVQRRAAVAQILRSFKAAAEEKG